MGGAQPRRVSGTTCVAQPPCGYRPRTAAPLEPGRDFETRVFVPMKERVRRPGTSLRVRGFQKSYRPRLRLPSRLPSLAERTNWIFPDLHTIEHRYNIVVDAIFETGNIFFTRAARAPGPVIFFTHEFGHPSHAKLLHCMQVSDRNPFARNSTQRWRFLWGWRWDGLGRSAE